MPKKPILIQVGDSLVDPTDVAAIHRVNRRKDLYVVRLKSQPNAEYPLWACEKELATLLTYFTVVSGD